MQGGTPGLAEWSIAGLGDCTTEDFIGVDLVELMSGRHCDIKLE